MNSVENIVNFPTEIRLTIFTYLSSADRRVASESCKRFFEIWLRDVFIDDRRLVFDKCVLDPGREPLSTFLKSSRNYQHLVFSDVIMRGESVFAGKFVETVSTIEFTKSFRTQSVNITKLLSQFPNLKTIKVEYFNQMLENCPDLPITVELLVISGFGSDFDKITSNYFDKTSFRVELKGRIKANGVLDFTDSQRKKILRANLIFWDQNDLIKLPHFENLKYLNVAFLRGMEYQQDLFDDVEKQCPALKHLSLNIQRRLPHKNWSYLKTLKVSKISKEELSRLSIFENLEELRLESNEECFFMHEAFLNQNLMTLEINSASDDPCFTCFQKMTKSFPELENFTCRFKVTNDHLDELATNTPKLKCLTLVEMDPALSFERLSNLTELILNHRFSSESETIKTWPLMLNLRKIQLSFQRFDFETVKVFEKMPALEDLFIGCDDSKCDNHVSFFETMSKSLKRLKKVWISFRAQVNYAEIVDVMVGNCIYLRDINCPNDNGKKEDWEQLLRKDSSLRSINGIWLEK